jgi:hypothetical protein
LNQLVEEYFKRDLSEAEELQLSQALADSPQDAQEMARGMEALYRLAGHAEPVWTEKPLPFQAAKFPLEWLKVGLQAVFVLALLGLLVYLVRFTVQSFHPQRAGIHESAVIARPEKNEILEKHTMDINRLPSPSPILKTPSAPAQPSSLQVVKGKPSKTKAWVSIPPTARPNNLSLPLSGQARATDLKPAAKRPSTSQAQGREIQLLSVVVENRQSGLATVKVFDAGHSAVRLIYAGILPSGKQTFIWDGSTDQGVVAPPGVYYVEVKSGSQVLRKEIHVEPDHTP